MTDAPTPRRLAVAAARELLHRRGLRAEGALFADGVADDGIEAPRVGSFAELASIYPRWLAGPSRKGSGSWFTPRELAEPLATRTLEPLRSSDRPLRIVDPACGGGAFLAAALRARVAAGVRAREVAEHELFGLDADATAAQLAAWVVHEACGDDAPAVASVERHVHAGDGLVDLEPGTFDAVLGNPPWETVQKGQGLDSRTRLAGAQRVALADRGKTYTYRLFVARALELLRPGGRLGLVLPASLYFDRDARALREHLMHRCRWEWLFGFENRERVFAIDGRYRFCCVVAETDARTDVLRAAFLRTDVQDWARPDPPHLALRPDDLLATSPASGAFVEVRDERDLALLRRMHARGEPLLGDAAPFGWRQGDFNMTADRARFVPCERAAADGYRQREDGVFRDARGDALHALLQGAMIDVLHPNAGAYAGGEGRAVRWRPPTRPDRVEPQFLLSPEDVPSDLPPRVALRALSNASNARSAIACLIGPEACGNSLGVLRAKDAERPLLHCAFAAGVLASLAWDWALRQRLAGTNLNAFVLADTVLPRVDEAQRAAVAVRALALCAVLPWHATLWERARAEGWSVHGRAPALDAEARTERRVELEVLVARAFELTRDDLAWMLRNCDLPTEVLRDRGATSRLDPKGFWRVDRGLDPGKRLPVRVLRAAAEPSAAVR